MPPIRSLRNIAALNAARAIGMAGAIGLCRLLAAGTAAAAVPATPPDRPGWPEVQREARPWTRWWWPGSAVTPEGIKRQLELFAQAGLGGVEVTPIYGAQDTGARAIDFLSPRWMAMLRETAGDARRLDLGVDMVTGTGWPFGGPWVTAADAAGKPALLGGRIAGEPTGMKVKRAAPGGEGLVLDPFSAAAMRRYLMPFAAAFSALPPGSVRAQFHDSFEYYGAGWSPGFAGEFQRMQGYDVQAFAAGLFGQTPLPDDQLSRLKSDYRATLAAMHLEYIRAWARWSHEHGFVVRNQSHGAPANLLDLYGAVDIPETETFGSTPFPIPGLRREPADIDATRDLPEPLMMRMASSAAHVNGHPLVSSETCTWLREHWKTALSCAKPEIDRLFVNGINHVFYHGTVYSPPEIAWPGWLFYASTEFNPNNTWWNDFPALNHYVARVQSVLQSGKPDNDVLLYWPFADALDGSGELVRQFGVHDVGWLTDSPFGRAARELAHAGYGFDYVSDAQLAASKVAGGNLCTTGGTAYRILIVPATRRMPVETLAKLLALARAGAVVQIIAPPTDVPGLGELEKRRGKFRILLDELAGLARLPGSTLHLGAGPSAGGLDLALVAAHAEREPMVDAGLSLVRRRNSGGNDYFVVNQGAHEFEGWVTLGVPCPAALLLDPLTDRIGLAAIRHNLNRTEIFLQLAPDESLLVQTFPPPAGPVAHPAWRYLAPSGATIALAGRWQVEFIKGGPDLPPAMEVEALKSWTDCGGEAAQSFGGTARYTLSFTLPATGADDWLLDLGDVRESARVRLNHREVAVAWSLPFRLHVGDFLQPGTNLLEIEVTNLAANRIRDLDRRHVAWKIMREINFVNIHYRPFDASDWPLTPSGLLGPVTLSPLRLIHPQ